MVYEKRRESQVGTKLGASTPELVTSLRMKSTLLKWLMRIGAAIFSLLFMAFIALQSEKVQVAAARTLASKFEQQQGLTLEFDSLKINWWSQEVALIDARKAVAMFDKTNVRVLGIVENMSYFLCPSDGVRYDIFGHGGGEREASRLGVPLLGEIPIDMATREASDTGMPLVARSQDSPIGREFMKISQAVRAAAETPVSD